MAQSLDSLMKAIPPKKMSKKGSGHTATYKPASNQEVLSLPTYREHLIDIFDTRYAEDSRSIIKTLFKQDPDVSAAVNAYLTISNTDPVFVVRNTQGEIDRNGMKMLEQAILLLTRRFDYSKGFLYKPGLMTIIENLRYMLLLRGGVMAELVFNEKMVPSEFRQIDLQSVRWYEKEPGLYKPIQMQQGTEVSLDFPSMFVAFHHRDPTEIYTNSNFVSAINTIAARQQVVNDLYRIMQVTGYPRMDVKVLEEVLLNSAPGAVKSDPDELRQWLNARLGDIRTSISTLRPDQAFVHWDSIEAGMINDKAPGMAINIEPVIDVLNGQNQAALKTMATIIGRGESGVNTASVEARVFALSCDELNEPIAELLSQAFTFLLRFHGFDGYVETQFRKVEMRPEMELEAQQNLRQARLLTDLSHGLITDDEYHMMMYNRPRPDKAPEMSGTGFQDALAEGSVDAGKVSPNSDPLGRSVSSKQDKSAKSNAAKK